MDRRAELKYWSTEYIEDSEGGVYKPSQSEIRKKVIKPGRIKVILKNGEIGLRNDKNIWRWFA